MNVTNHNHNTTTTFEGTMRFSIVLVGLVSLSGFGYGCVTTDLKYVNTTSKIIGVEPTSTAIKHMVAGAVKFTTGCSFFVRNMTIIPTGNSAYWYGIPVKNNTDPYPRVVTAALGSYNGQSVTFTLDPQYSFDEISIMEIRSEGDGRAYGAFAVSGKMEEVEAYYKVQKGANVDFDPTKPFSSANIVSVPMAGSMTILFSAITAFMRV